MCCLIVAALWVIGCAEEVSPPPGPRGTWSLVVLPDTQKYVAFHPEIVYAQTRWIVENARAFDIRGVLHMGDITDDNSDAQWEIAAEALHDLDGHVPYVLVPGNHDYGLGGEAGDRTTQLNTRFPFAEYSAMPTFEESFEPGRIDSHAQILETPMGEWLVVALEFGPRDQVIAWADGVLSRHATLPAILITHAHTYSDDTRYDKPERPDQEWSPYDYPLASLEGGVNDGREIYDALVVPHENVRFVLSGHVLNDGLGRVTSTRPSGVEVDEILQNYQMNRLGGEGYLRLYEFSADGRHVDVRSYSPYLNEFKVDAANEFRIELGLE